MARTPKYNEPKEGSPLQLRLTTTAKQWTKRLPEGLADLVEQLARDEVVITGKSKQKSARYNTTQQVPVAFHHASAGESGIIDEGFVEDTIELPREWLKGGGDGCFVFPIRGDSMEPVLTEGCKVVVNPNLNPENGSIAVIQSDYRLQCKQYHLDKKTKQVTLKSLNPNYGDIVMDCSLVQGVWPVVVVYKQL